jgi:hypothetical protein
MTLTLLGVSGCFVDSEPYVVVYNPRYPVYDVPKGPQLQNVPGSEMNKLSPDARRAIKENFEKEIQYSARLRTVLETYNDFARRQNAQESLYSTRDNTSDGR